MTLIAGGMPPADQNPASLATDMVAAPAAPSITREDPARAGACCGRRSMQ
eukprot:CAMPEP_0182904808 /NCGR_PEP_ID=MMETSP0034_2-20130328/32410_1 /TAXON_ID=156128 /ORGANISM="Nephroselmis pyriformis, Strain CCMP717" /LENGTH=49 /DNA_ID=CAMNT_0025040039 /DNA_START=99 /DNA_END=249 /DNA_ORIENTATION=+